MPLRIRPATGPPQVHRLKIPRPVVLVVPPKQRLGSKQLTCLRFDEHGQYFVDEFVERLHTAGWPEERRFMTHVICPKLQFQVALGVCHRYCSFPCHVHLDVIAARGWYNNGKAAPIFHYRTEKKRGRTERDDED